MINRKDLLGVLALSEGWGRHSLDSAKDLQQIFPALKIVLHLCIILGLCFNAILIYLDERGP